MNGRLIVWTDKDLCPLNSLYATMISTIDHENRSSRRSWNAIIDDMASLSVVGLSDSTFPGLGDVVGSR